LAVLFYCIKKCHFSSWIAANHSTIFNDVITQNNKVDIVYEKCKYDLFITNVNFKTSMAWFPFKQVTKLLMDTNNNRISTENFHTLQRYNTN